MGALWRNGCCAQDRPRPARQIHNIAAAFYFSRLTGTFIPFHPAAGAMRRQGWTAMKPPRDFQHLKAFILERSESFPKRLRQDEME
jgi:hypothetical protein